jgi:hypothetical protein
MLPNPKEVVKYTWRYLDVSHLTCGVQVLLLLMGVRPASDRHMCRTASTYLQQHEVQQ